MEPLPLEMKSTYSAAGFNALHITLAYIAKVRWICLQHMGRSTQPPQSHTFATQAARCTMCLFASVAGLMFENSAFLKQAPNACS